MSGSVSMAHWLLFGLLLLSTSPGETASSKASQVPFLDSTKEPAEWLSSYHFFANGRAQLPNPSVFPYDLNTPHFADDATLRRFFWLPEHAQIYVNENAALVFPIGSVLILTVSYPNNKQTPSTSGDQLIETRLLIHRPSGWTTAQYIWNEEATDARLAVAGGVREVSWIDQDGKERSHRYHLPNQNQCKQCHEIGDQLRPLGPVHARHVNRVRADAAETENQIQHWRRLGLLAGVSSAPPEMLPKGPVWNDPSTGTVEERARAYLDMNCSSCHRPHGLAYTSGLDLTFDQHIPFRFGVFKAPVAAGRGVGNARFAIFPARPDESMLLHRMASTDPGIRMPIVGGSLVHEEGLALIREWIAQMDDTQPHSSYSP